MRFSSLKYPGDGYYYILCDVCGGKVRLKDAIQVKDKYNFLNGLLVCKEDYEKTNPQAYLRARKERRNPVISRGEGLSVSAELEDMDNYAMYFYVDYDNSQSFMAELYSETGNGNFEIDTGTASVPPYYEPQPPQFMQVVDISSSSVSFLWGGFETAFFSIDGFMIERSTGGSWSTISANTHSEAPYYTDSTVLPSTTYLYRVGGINVAGVGAPGPVLTITTSAS